MTKDREHTLARSRMWVWPAFDEGEIVYIDLQKSRLGSLGDEFDIITAGLSKDDSAKGRASVFMAIKLLLVLREVTMQPKVVRAIVCNTAKRAKWPALRMTLKAIRTGIVAPDWSWCSVNLSDNMSLIVEAMSLAGEIERHPQGHWNECNYINLMPDQPITSSAKT